MADQLKEEFTQVIIKYRGPGGNKSNNTGLGAQAIEPHKSKMVITRIEDDPIAHDVRTKGGWKWKSLKRR